MGSERPQCLVIDGHPLVRLGVREALRGDFQVHESANRTEGLELIRDVGDIDVTIVDLRRWGNGEGAEFSGREAIRALKRRLSDIVWRHLVADAQRVTAH